MNIKEKKVKRAGLVNQMRSILNVAETANRELTADETTKYNQIETDVDLIGKEIDREDRLAVTENHLRGRKDHDYRPGAPEAVDGKRNSKEYRNSLFNQYARHGKNGLTSEHVNSLSEGSDTAGGYLVPEEFESQMTENLVMADPIRAGATVVRTGSDRNIPIETDTGTFGYVAEAGTFAESDPTVGRVILSAFKSGGIIKVSEELLQDSAFAVEPYLQRLASRRYNTLEQTAHAVGSGSGQPKGIFVTTDVGGVAPLNVGGGVSATAVITGDDMIELFHKLARSYRDRAVFITGDTMVKMLRKLKGEDNQYLWQPGLVAGQPDRILGRPVLVSDGAPTPAVSTVSIVIADLSYYMIVDRLGLSMQVLKELYAATGQVGFRFSKRGDGRMTFAPAMATFTHGAAA